MRTSLLSVALAALLAGPVAAQDAGDDWDIVREPDQKLVMAYTAFDNGLSIGLRCADGGYEALIAGLPAVAEDEETRSLGIAFGDEEMRTQSWNVATNPTVAIGELPAPFARKLRLGGRLQILVEGGAEDGRNLRYALDLPASASAVDETLTRCGRPLVDPRDAELEALPDSGLPANIVWTQPPSPRFPAAMRYSRGFAVLSCLTRPDGALRDCVIESEHPRGGGFAAAALRGAERARVSASDGGPIPTGRLVYRTNFRMAETNARYRTGSHVVPAE
ncbi:MAG: hypothetical protein H2038_07735 [Brevundimonas sp.]|uniref:hypothetical protein n=1 Tax=Brevundimonas sp. TaxID=1871086 RepID=UPI0017F60A13|nr:hypothetical protein [Brevundimonas sp.]MBA4804522.1 hypothetical protein [Brevundimonas sp.]